jgi:hypothetical protein
MKARAIAHDVIAVPQPTDRASEQCPQPLLALHERQSRHAPTVEMEKVEDDEHQVVGATLRALNTRAGWAYASAAQASASARCANSHDDTSRESNSADSASKLAVRLAGSCPCRAPN